ncbi:hypothetical protein [Paenibacillus periandrae]|uniref:hypothetical protein n=1 Tax=Paenibacillus periandrae TaxID=1761741 RepID=UPI001F0916E5|nr:hypothetical protein [Paenibacillus periandrae]
MKDKWEVFYLHQSEFDLSSYRILNDAQEIMYCNEESNNVTIVNFKYRTARIIYTDYQVNMKLLEDCYSVIKHLCYLHVIDQGGCLLHSCSVRYNNKTIIIMGEKGAGKTTIQHYLMHTLKASFISADRTLVWKKEGRLFCAGWISTYRPSIDVLSFLPNDEARLNLTKYYDKYKENQDYFQKNKIRMSPSNLIHCLKIKSISYSLFDVGIFIKYDEKQVGYSLKKMTDNSFDELMLNTIDPSEEGILSIALKDNNTNSLTLVGEDLKKVNFYRLTGRGDLCEFVHLLEKNITGCEQSEN